MGNHDGSYGIDLKALRDIYGIECLEANDVARGSVHAVAVFQDPEYDFMIFPLVVDWLDGRTTMYAMRLEEGIGGRFVVPSMNSISIQKIASDDAMWVGSLGSHPDASIVAQYINGFIEQGEWAKWFPANP